MKFRQYFIPVATYAIFILKVVVKIGGGDSSAPAAEDKPAEPEAPAAEPEKETEPVASEDVKVRPSAIISSIFLLWKIFKLIIFL